MSQNRRVAISLDLEWFRRYHTEIFIGTQRYAREQGWDCVVDPHVAPSLKPRKGNAGFDGVIARAPMGLAKRATELNIPLVNVWLNSPVTEVAAVVPDTEMTGRCVAEHLLGRGLRNFGYLGYKRDRGSRSQCEGFDAALADAGFPCSTFQTSSNHSANADNWGKLRSSLLEWIDTWTLPIGICTNFDLLSRYVAGFCRHRGLNVPNDVAIVGAGDEPAVCEHPTPSLSSVDESYGEIGYAAAELLDQMMGGAPAPSEPVRIACKGVIVRESSDVFAVGDEAVSAALHFITEQFQPIAVSDVVEQVSASRRTLERRFRDLLGRSIAAEIERTRVERAKRRLVDSNTPIKQIAVETGFVDAGQMCKVFARVVGVSPGDYRRRSRRY